MTLIKSRPSFFDADLLDLPMPGRLFNGGPFRGEELPAVNIRDNPDSFQLELATPGYRKDELKVNVENGVLTISSETEKESQEEKNNYTRHEFSYSAFTRSFQLPDTADEGSVKASFNDGILRVSIPKKKSVPTRAGKEVKIA